MNNGKKNRKKKKIKIDIGGLTIYLSDDTQKSMKKNSNKKDTKYMVKNNEWINRMNSQNILLVRQEGYSKVIGILFPRCSHTLGCF